MNDEVIRATGLVKNYGEVRALDGLDLAVPQGTVLGLLGPNGAGKTTAVRILTTLLQPDAGAATVAGIDLLAQPEQVRKRIGLSGQYAAVDEHLTGYENLDMIGRLYRLGRQPSRVRARELLERFGLTEAGDRPVKTYSGGMRRRLDLAGALVANPAVLFLDEPTTGLDPRSRTDMWDVIRELVGGGTTLLLTTQYLEEADRLAHDIAVVDHGHVIARGTPGDLKSRLGSTVIEIGLSDEDEARRAVGLLAPFVPGSPEQEGALVRVNSDDGPRVLIEVLRSLDTHQLAPGSLTVREPSLDDVFLALTGHHAEAEAPEQELVGAGRPGRRGRG
jgi:ABC-2 type transport system ATP-binding protein